jgi:hypothetical protein
VIFVSPWLAELGFDLGRSPFSFAAVSRVRAARADSAPATHRNKNGGYLPAVYQIVSANFID